MLVRHSALVALIVLAAPAAAARAQVRGDPGVVIDGRVGVRIYVTMRETEAPYSYYPVADHRLAIARADAPGDTTVVRTDGAGVANVWLPPGDYRLTSAEAVSWRGTIYRWALPLYVRPDMRVVDLEPTNALRSSAAAISSATGSGATPCDPRHGSCEGRAPLAHR